MARTMQTARKITGDPAADAAERARQLKDMAEADIRLEEEEFIVPSCVQPGSLQSLAASSSRTGDTLPPQPAYNLLAADIPLPTIFAFAAQTLDMPSEQVQGKMREVLSREMESQNFRNQGRTKKVTRAKVDVDGIEWLGNIDPRYEADDKNCRIYQEEQEMRLGISVGFEYRNVGGRSSPMYSEGGTYRKDPAIIKALTALVQHTVGDNNKLFLAQDFCLKRQSDTSVEAAGKGDLKKMIVLDDDHQDTALFRYVERPYSQTQRQMMQYTSCIPEDGKAEERHWRHSLEGLLASRNQQDQPFSTRVKIFLVNRPDDTVDQLQSGRDFTRAFPYLPSDQRYFDQWHEDRNKGIWKSLRMGFTFEVYVNPAKLYITPSNIVPLNNRRVLLQAFCPGSVAVRAAASDDAPVGISLDDFYSNLTPASVPPISLDAYQPFGMTAQLMPFQKRSVAWLLEREQTTVPQYQTVGMWERLALGTGAETVTIAYNRVTGEAMPLWKFDAWNKGKGKGRTDERSGESGAVVFDEEILQEERDDFGLKDIRGGMLCEEMGLGKTLEVLALIMLSEENNVKLEGSMGSTTYDAVLELNVTKVQATLIVTPPSLIGQWHLEIRKHAPELKVLIYEGWRTVHDQFYASGGVGGKRKRGAPDVDDTPQRSTIDKWVDKVKNADIVLTTFAVVQADWNVAPPPVKRTRRSTAAYVEHARPRSALLLCDWRRVCIDEIQELDIASAGKAASMIRTIKRRYSLAISGTPAKASIEDLFSSLTFLTAKVSPRVWKRITTPAFAPTFHAVFRNIAIRHIKAALSPQDMTMAIPQQRRFLVPVRLSRVERAYYNDTYETSIDSLQRSPSGFADIAKLRTVLHTLRMICDHVQVGQLRPIAAGADRIRLDGGLLTMMEALRRMEEDAETMFLSRLFELARSRMRQAQLLILGSSSNWPNVNTIYQDVYRECDKTLTDLERRIKAVEDQARKSASDSNEDATAPENASGDRDIFVTVLRGRTHDLYVLQHEASFRLGDIFSSTSVNDERKAEKEEEWYGIAGKIRSGLLKSSALAADSYRDLVKKAVLRSNVDEFEELEIDFAKHLGLLGSRVQDPLNARIDALNDNAEFLWNVRGKIVARLLEAIGDNAEDGAGAKDYELTLEEQYELESNMWIYQLAMADRREFMIEERTALSMHEDRTAAARPPDQDDMAEPVVRNLPAASASDDVKAKLIKERDTIRAAAQEGISLKAAQFDLNQIAGRNDVRYQESAICKAEAERLKTTIKSHMDITKRLTDEFAVFNSCFNRRVAYYRALQAISDTLVDVELEGDVEEDLAKNTDQIIAAKAAYDKANSRRKYLESIRNEDEESADGCPICQESFGQRGAKEIVILNCLHRLCAPCYKTLRNRFRKPICPTCRADISAGDDVKKITLQKPERTAEEGLGKISADDQSSAWLSAHIHPEHFHIAPETPEMLSIRVHGSWGSKIDRLIRNLRDWRIQEPDVKHIIFSSWQDALAIVQAALSLNDINWLSRSGKKNDNSVQRFNEDASITAFLLNGERENSGLTLTSASVCHLLEPVINSGFETQAIGRVDRVGQTRETTVYCYAAEDTVEAKIVNRAKDNHSSLYAKVQDDSGSRRIIQAASAARKGGDDLSGNRDDILDLLLH